MALFGRSARKKRGKHDEPAPVADGTEGAGSDESSSDSVTDAAPQAGRGISHGPWDVAEAPEIGSKIDLGSIWLPGIHEMTLRMEIDKKTQMITGAAVVSAGSALQVQAFAAPRTEGIWDEIRAEIAQSLTAQGASVDDIAGAFGRELLAQIPATDAEGKKVQRVVRFLGVDGPRWFMRGVISGKGATDAEAAKPLEELFRNITVLRDPSPRAPRDVLPMKVPQRGPARKEESGEPEAAAEAGSPGFDPLKRGPEITEIR